MPQPTEKPSASSTTSPAGTFLLTPDQHREQAALLRLSDDPECERRAAIHEQIAAAIEARSAAYQEQEQQKMGAVHIYVHDHRRPRARDQADGDREEIERQIAFVERLANEQERRGYKNVAEEYRATARNLRAQLEGRPGEKIKMAGFKTSKDASVPMRVQYKGETYWHTGKMGTHIATGEPSAEYESEEHSERTGRIEKTGRRLWRRASGAIEPDSAMGSRDEAAAMAEELKGLVERGHGSSLRARELRQHIK